MYASLENDRVPRTSLFLISFPALAWSKAGHMLTGALAYYELKTRDPVALARVISLLKRHPAYELEWAPAIADFENADPDTEGLFLFMYAARWPDDIRDDPDLHCEQCHYINYPYRPGHSSPLQQPPGENVIRAAHRMVQGSERFGSVQNKARSVKARPDLARASLPELSETRFEWWARAESFEAAKRHGYRNGTLVGSSNSSNGAVLPQGYATNAQEVAIRRAMLAGYRLSDMLQGWF